MYVRNQFRAPLSTAELEAKVAELTAALATKEEVQTLGTQVATIQTSIDSGTLPQNTTPPSNPLLGALFIDLNEQ